MRCPKQSSNRREYLDDLVLFDVDETLGGVHQEVDFIEQERGMRHQGFHIAHDFAQYVCLIWQCFQMTQQEGDITLSIHQTEADIAITVL